MSSQQQAVDEEALEQLAEHAQGIMLGEISSVIVSYRHDDTVIDDIVTVVIVIVIMIQLSCSYYD